MSGKIYREHAFVAGKLEAIFDRLDANGNGGISIAEFMAQSVDGLSEEEVAELKEEFEVYDADHNGRIDKFEFVTKSLERYQNVSDKEFHQWVQAMLDPKMLKPHHAESLKRAGIDVEDDYIDPPTS